MKCPYCQTSLRKTTRKKSINYFTCNNHLFSQIDFASNSLNEHDGFSRIIIWNSDSMLFLDINLSGETIITYVLDRRLDKNEWGRSKVIFNYLDFTPENFEKKIKLIRTYE